jgi:hypothetical protein
LAIILISCSNSKNIFIKKDKNTNKKSKNITSSETVVSILPIAELGKYPTKSDKIDILGVQITENVMTLNIGYSGSCKDHEFSLIGSQMISKSLPPIRNIQLVHNSNDDNCENYVTQTLSVDIRNFAYKKAMGSNIILKLNGWKDQIIYTYN